MRRIATIILTLVIVLGLGGGAYAYVASQREWWPFDNSLMNVTTSGFSDLVAKDLAAYAYLDLSNPNVAAKVASNPELMQNVKVLGNALQQAANGMMQSNTAVISDDSTRQQVEAEIVQAFQYLSSKKIHLAWDTATSTNTTLQAPGNVSIGFTTPTQTNPINGTIVVGIETTSAEDANQTLVTIKGFMHKDAETAAKEITIANQPVSEISTLNADGTAGQAKTYLTNIANKLIVLTTNQAAMESVIQKSQTTTAETFSNNESFKALAAKLTGPQLATIYLDNLQYLNTMEGASATGNSPSELKMMQDLAQNPAYNSKTISGVTFNNKGLFVEGYTSFATPQMAAQFANSNTSYASSLPNDTLVFEEGHNFTQLVNVYVTPMLDTIEQMAMTEGTESPVQAFQAMEQALNISIKNDLAPLFTKTSAIAIHRANSMLVPVAVSILTEITDRTAAEATMAKLANALVEQVGAESGVPLPAPTSTLVDGTITVHSAGEMQGLETLFNYATTTDGKHLLVSSSLDAITTIIDLMKTPAASLAQSPKYPEILKNVPANNMVAYVDIKGIADAFLPFLTLAMDEEAMTMFNAEAKPVIDTLNNLALYSTLEGDMQKSVMQLQLVK